jgi:hypothetical protein
MNLHNVMLLKFNFIFLLSLIGVSMSCSQESSKNYAIQVVDGKGKPISHAFIQMYTISNNRWTKIDECFTDDLGKCSFNSSEKISDWWPIHPIMNLKD